MFKLLSNSVFILSLLPYLLHSYFAFAFQSAAAACGAGMGVPGYMGFNAPGMVGYY